MAEVCGPQKYHFCLGWAVGEQIIVCYAGDGRIAGQDHIWIQEALMVMVMMFWRMGLEADLEKKSMLITPDFI